MAKAIRVHSITQSLPSKGINFLKSRSVPNAIIAVTRQAATNSLAELCCVGTADVLPNKINPAVTRQIEVTIFNGVSFNFYFLNFLFFFCHAGALAAFFFAASAAAEAIAAACFFSWKAPLKSGSSLRF